MTAAQADAGSIEHLPVLYQSVLHWLQPKPGMKFVDGTIGGGGHAEGILRQGAWLLGTDRDEEALRTASRRLAPYRDRMILRHGSYRQAPEMMKEIGWSAAAGIVLDLGISSLQLADPQRGFAFRQEGPLDMRFDRSGGETAADLVNTLPEDEIAQILFRYGEERQARRIAKAILGHRPLRNTRELAETVAKAIGSPGGERSRMHPATRTFQALRIAVNHELEEMEAALPLLMDCLEEGGRMAVISFHSLEDRIVKQSFHRAAGKPVWGEERWPVKKPPIRFRELTKKPVQAEAEEISANPRARSAKLRVVERIRFSAQEKRALDSGSGSTGVH